MTLVEFLAQTGQSATTFAAKVGCEVSTVTRLLRGERRPSIDLALRIEMATEGKVTPSNLIQSSSSTPEAGS
jgi:plasmid maintenance system antidote protein VapI